MRFNHLRVNFINNPHLDVFLAADDNPPLAGKIQRVQNDAAQKQRDDQTCEFQYPAAVFFHLPHRNRGDVGGGEAQADRNDCFLDNAEQEIDQ